jgi:hypothetical protein
LARAAQSKPQCDDRVLTANGVVTLAFVVVAFASGILLPLLIDAAKLDHLVRSSRSWSARCLDEIRPPNFSQLACVAWNRLS